MKLLEINGLDAYYGDFQALFNLSFHLNLGECLAIVGSNGAGKSTLFSCLTGLVKSNKDSITYDHHPLGGKSPAEIVQLGIAMVPEGRKLFRSLSVEENLLIGGFSGRKGPWELSDIYKLFPVLAERKKDLAINLSGGQQQMVAIGRALMVNPKLLLCDEISLGLAPVIVKDIYEVLPRIREEGTSVILVEQDVGQALRAADHLICLQEGRIALDGKPDQFSREEISTAYFGV